MRVWGADTAHTWPLVMAIHAPQRAAPAEVQIAHMLAEH